MSTLKITLFVLIVSWIFAGCSAADRVLDGPPEVDEKGNLPPGYYDPDSYQEITLDRYYREMVEQAKVIVQNNPEQIKMDGYGRFMGFIENKLGPGKNNDFHVTIYKADCDEKVKSITVKGGAELEEVYLFPGKYYAICSNRLETFTHPFEVTLATDTYHKKSCHFFLFSGSDGYGDIRYESGSKFDEKMLSYE